MVGMGLGLGLALASRAAPLPFLPIVNRANTTVTPLGGGSYRIAKTGGVDGGYDASAVSSVGAAGDFVMRAVMSVLNDSQLGAIGMNSDPLTNDDYASLDYSLLLSSGTWYVYESGGNPGSFVDTGAPVWIRRVAGVISYGQGATLETATFLPRTVVNAATLFFDSSIQDTTARLDVSVAFS